MDDRESFVKHLFAGTILEERIFPYPKLAEQDEENVRLIISSIEKFAQDGIDSKKIDEEAKIPDEVFQWLKEMGIMGMVIPEAHGGSGMSQTAYCKVMEKLTEIDASIAVSVGAHQSIGMKAILLFGTEEQKKTYLPTLSTGEKIAAFALTEATAGSDAGSIKTKAVLSSDGQHFILNGSKLWITNGGIADVFTIFAKTEEPDPKKPGSFTWQVSAFIVERNMGIISQQEEHKLGIKGSSTTALVLEDVKVPVKNLLGERGKGFKIAMEVLNSGRLGLGSGCVGGAKKMIRLAADYAKERKQFNEPVGNFELIKEYLAEAAVSTYAAESAVYLTSSFVDRGVKDFSLESAICKVFCSTSLWQTVNACLQIAGGNGYMKDYAYERYLRDSRINLIFEGTNEILTIYIALSGLQGVGQYLKEVGKAAGHLFVDPIQSLGVFYDYALTHVKRAVHPQKMSAAHAALAKESQTLEELTADFANGCETVLREHGKGIMTKQHVLRRVAQAATDLYVMFATLSRTSSEVAVKGEKGAELEISLCKNFFSRAKRRIRTNLSEFACPRDRYVNEIANRVLQG